MIIKEEKKAFPPGTLVSSFSTKQFNCIVTTTRDGFLIWRLTTSINTWEIIENHISWSPFMKLTWKQGLEKSEIHGLHNEVVYGLDKMGGEGKDFGSALNHVLSPIADKGLISKIKYKNKVGQWVIETF
jgi:hypothetical protein